MLEVAHPHLLCYNHCFYRVRCINWHFPDGAPGIEPTCQCGRCKRHRFSLWVGKIAWKRSWIPLPYSFLENLMDRWAWRATVHRVAQSQTWLKQLNMQAYINFTRRPFVIWIEKYCDTVTSYIVIIKLFFKTMPILVMECKDLLFHLTLVQKLLLRILA